PKYMTISKAYKKILSELKMRKPLAIILIDYPGFNLRLLKDAYNLGITTIYHIPPKAWSHGEHRADVLKNFSYLVTGILPFEFDFFKSKDVNIKFIGNPLKDNVEEYISAHRVQKEPYKIGILPGSRESELKKLLPILIEAFVELEKAENKVVAHIPIASTISKKFAYNLIYEIKNKYGLHDDWFHEKIKIGFGNAYEVLNSCEYAWVCSGTATLEAAFFSTPMSVMYKVSPLTYYLAKKYLKIKYVSLVNLCTKKETIPEFLQGQANVKNLIDHALSILKNKEAKQKMMAELSVIKELFPQNAAKNAASEIVQCILKYNLPPEVKFHVHHKTIAESLYE
ncbi:MAG: hypothetical protein V4591_01835, partial [Bdellovibrionota bacterium]